MREEDAEQLARLWTSAQRDVAAFLRGTVEAQHVPDLLQQTAVKLVRNFDRYDSSRPFIPWAIGIAKHEVLAWRRTRATDRHLFSDKLVQQLADVFAESTAAERPLDEALSECLKLVEGRSRQALEMHYIEGQKTDQVAASLSMSSGALRMLLCRVRESIRRCIQHRLANEGGV